MDKTSSHVCGDTTEECLAQAAIDTLTAAVKAGKMDDQEAWRKIEEVKRLNCQPGECKFSGDEPLRLKLEQFVASASPVDKEGDTT